MTFFISLAPSGFLQTFAARTLVDSKVAASVGRKAHRPTPEALHPTLWRAHQLEHNTSAALSSGFAPLDAQLPGGGWPCRVLTELVLPHPGVGEMRLLAPVLARVCAAGRALMLFDPPAEPNGWVLAAWGIPVERIVVVRGRAAVRGHTCDRHDRLPSADVLWALEQALRSGHVGAVLAWLPQRLRVEALRRLQLAAHAHDGPAFVLRDSEARLRPSPAPLRLWLQAAGPDRLAVRVFKRRGPALDRALQLDLPSVLPPSAVASQAFESSAG